MFTYDVMARRIRTSDAIIPANELLRASEGAESASDAVFSNPAAQSSATTNAASEPNVGWPGYFLPITPNPFFDSFCKDLGLDDLTGNLFAWLGGRLPVTRVVCFTLEKRTRAMMFMADVSEYPSLMRRILDIGGILPLAAMENPLRDMAQVIFLRADDPRSRLFLDAIESRHASAMCLLLHQDEEFAQYFGVFSDRLDAFTLEHAQILAPLRPPFMACLSRRFYEFSLRQGTAITPKTDPVELLRMCEGLLPLMRRVERIAPTEQPVVIMGETGVGKELVAEAVYRLSSRRLGPIVRINCGAISESLVDSELFGHEKGSFTGAISGRAGYFEQADGGTIFLDELGELPPAIQVRLLRVLDHGEIRRVGGNRPIQLDIRVIAATNRDLAKEVKAGRFREDLWYRLCVYPLRIPSLRERPEDVLTLLKYFIASKAARLGLESIPRLDTRDLHAVIQSPWPGNVRQLEHSVERALLEYQLESGSPWLRVALDPSDDEPPASDTPHTHAPDPLLTLDDMTRKHITRVLTHTHGKISGPKGAAALLGLPSSTLRAKMRRLGIAGKDT